MQMIVMLYLDVNQQMLDNVILRYTVVVCLSLSLSVSLSLCSMSLSVSLSLSLMDTPLPQVYIRRAYIAYEVNCLQHRELQGDMSMVEFKFLLPRSHPNRYNTQIIMPQNMYLKYTSLYKLKQCF